MKNKEKYLLDILNKHKNLIYKICHLNTNVHEDFLDLYQEIIYQLWKSFDKFEGKSGINTWIYRVALNTALYNLRKTETECKKFTDFTLDAMKNELMSLNENSRSES